MNTRKEQGDSDRLKTELRRLRRAGAPWYFESELHQRLHGGHTRRMRLRPFGSAQAIVLSLLAFISILVVTYVVVVNVNLFPQGSGEDSHGHAPPAIRSPEASPAVSPPNPEKLESPALTRTPVRIAGRSPADSSTRSYRTAVTANKQADSAMTLHPGVRSEIPLVVRPAAAQADSPQNIKGRDTSVSRKDTLSLQRDSVSAPHRQAPNR